MTKNDENTVCNADEIHCQEISDPTVLSKNPLVSVYMITYNHEPYIAQAIEGVLIQETDFPIELVIGEDCSTDHTRKIVLDYQKKYSEIIRVITSEKNLGAKKNGKRTLALCRGEYIAFCEGDDYWHHPKKLQMQVDYMEAHPECGLVHGDGARYFVDKCRTVPFYTDRAKEVVLRGENVVRSLIESNYSVITCSVIVRKDLVSEIRKTCQFEFREETLSGDFQSWVEIAYRSKVKYMDESFVTYNILPESALHSKNIEKIIRFQQYALEIHMHYANKYGGDDTIEIVKEVVRHFSNVLMGLACRAHNHDLAIEVMEMVQRYQIPLDPMSYLYFVGCHNKIAFYLVQPVVLGVRIGAKIVRVVKMFAKSSPINKSSKQLKVFLK